MRAIAILLGLLLLLPVARGQDDAEEQAKEEARLLKRARRLIEDGEKAEAWKALNDLATLARQREHNKTAIEALDDARAVAPTEEDEGHALLLLGHLELREGDNASSQKHYARAVKLLPKDARAWNNYAYALHLSGREDKAVEAYEKSVELDAGFHLAKVSLGESARLAGDAQKALKTHKRLVEKAKQGDLGERSSWYWAFESAKGKAAAKGATFETAGQRQALVELQVAVDHVFLDELAEAEEAIRDAKKAHEEGELAPALEKALDDLWRELELRSAHFQVHYVLGVLLEVKGDAAGSKAAYETFVEAEKAKRPFAKKAKEKVEAK